MAKIVKTLVKVKETKNKVQYNEEGDENKNPFRIYPTKEECKKLGNPEKIKQTLEPA